MGVPNTRIAELFDELADLLEIEGANPFRTRAYRNAARVVGSHSASFSDLIEKGEKLPTLPGIGKDLAGKIEEIIRTRHLAVLDETRKHFPPGIRAVLGIPGLGPKRTRILYDEFRIRDLDDLKRIVDDGSLRKLRGFGEKTEEKIRTELERLGKRPARIRLAAAEPTAELLLRFLKQQEGVKEAIIAGSYRRRKETIGDLDILVTAVSSSRVMDRVLEFEAVHEIVSRGSKRTTIILENGLQVDVRAVPQHSYGAALLYFTGSKAHNIAVRLIAIRQGYKLNEYGIFKGTKRIAGKTEEEVYARIGLPFIPPELREDRGEVTAALEGRLPRLIEVGDIKGDLHAHTKATDGRSTLEEMAEAAKARGYEYLAITDHSRRITVAKGQTPERLLDQLKKIDRLNSKLHGITILKSAEVDILENGKLDFPDSILKELDLTVCSIHSRFNLNREKQTERILRAMDNRYFNVLGHPTGRLIDQREPYAVDIERVIHEAADRHCLLELNSQPDRLDLSDAYSKAAKDAGVLLSLSTDAHSTQELGFIRYGIDQARRAWLEKKDVLNTRSLAELRKILKRA